MTFSVYILQSESTGRYYCGQTTDLQVRISQHNDPNNDLSKTTKRFKGPWKLIWSRTVGSGSESVRLERQIKKRGIGRFLQNNKGGCYRKPSNYEKPLGSKGYSNLKDYLIPVIQLMWNELDHKKAFRKIAQRLDVRYNTVSSQCTRALDLTTDEFIRQVNSRSIIGLLERKYPDQYQKIKAELKD